VTDVSDVVIAVSCRLVSSQRMKIQSSQVAVVKM